MLALMAAVSPYLTTAQWRESIICGGWIGCGLLALTAWWMTRPRPPHRPRRWR